MNGIIVEESATCGQLHAAIKNLARPTVAGRPPVEGAGRPHLVLDPQPFFSLLNITARLSEAARPRALRLYHQTGPVLGQVRPAATTHSLASAALGNDIERPGPAGTATSLLPPEMALAGDARRKT
jgi:hypothetical protein